VDNRKLWLHIARTWNFPEEVIQLWRGNADPKIRVSTRKLTEDASRLADSLGYTFTRDTPAQEQKERDFYSLLSTEKVLEIGETVERQVEVLHHVMNLPVPTPQEINKILFRTTHQLSKSNAKYIRTHNELENRVTLLEELTKVFTGIIRTLDSESLAFSVLESLMEGFHLDGAFMISLSGHDQGHGYSACKDDAGEPDVNQIQVNLHSLSSSLQECIRRLEPIRVDHPEEDTELKDYLGKVSLAWLVPVQVREQLCAVLGLGVRNSSDPKFMNDDFGKILRIVAGEVGLSIDNTRLYNHMQKEAQHDGLTGLLNRRSIMKVLASEFARFKRKQTPLTVAIFDMDNFKCINDTRGHLAGDEFLVRVAGILDNEIRDTDYIGRYGGDEFVAVFPDTGRKDGFRVVERMRKRLLKCCKDFEGPDLKGILSVSIGVADAEEGMGQADGLVLNADKALYAAKEGGRNRTEVFQPGVGV
jgi:diguanylate cyclase (GGDEF)-like protein